MAAKNCNRSSSFKFCASNALGLRYYLTSRLFVTLFFVVELRHDGVTQGKAYPTKGPYRLHWIMALQVIPGKVVFGVSLDLYLFCL